MNKIKLTTILVALIFQIKGLVAMRSSPYKIPVYNYNQKFAKSVRHSFPSACDVICHGAIARTYDENSELDSKILVRRPRSKGPLFQDGFRYVLPKEPIQCEAYISGFNVHIECAVVISNGYNDGEVRRFTEYYRENQRFIQLLISYSLYHMFLTYMMVHNIPDEQKARLILNEKPEIPMGPELMFASSLTRYCKSLMMRPVINSLPHTPPIEVDSKNIGNFYIKYSVLSLLRRPDAKKYKSYTPKYDSSYSFGKTNKKLDWLYEQLEKANDIYKKARLPEFVVILTWAYIMDNSKATANWERVFLLDKFKLRLDEFYGHLTFLKNNNTMRSV